jgi:3-phenylpropionate/cinnamic acid dioxygenase small subunit
VSKRDEIAELIYRYAELVDAGDFDGVGKLLSRASFGGPDTPMVTGAQEIAALFTVATRRFPEGSGRHRADPGTPKTRHLVLNTIIEIDGDTASARSTFCVVQDTDRVALAPIVVGRYYDTFARDGDGWYFTERIADVEMVGDVSDHLLIDPHHG